MGSCWQRGLIVQRLTAAEALEIARDVRPALPAAERGAAADFGLLDARSTRLYAALRFRAWRDQCAVLTIRVMRFQATSTANAMLMRPSTCVFAVSQQ